jgi:hypothetical protein
VKGAVLLASAVALATAGSATAPAPADPRAAEAPFEQALAAKERRDLSGYRDGIERAVSRLPDPTRLLYRLSSARLLAGDRAGAIEAFRRQVDAGLYRDPRPDPEFAPLLDDPAFRVELGRLDRLEEPVVASVEEARLAEKDLLVEGLAHDPLDGSLFLSSVHRRRILRRTANGDVTVFAELAGKAPGSPLGLAVDAERRRLWVATAGLPQGAGLPEKEKDRGAIAAFDLGSGALVELLAPDGAPHLFNDLTLARDGTVYASDPLTHAIYRRVAGRGAGLELVLRSEALASLGGLALSADEQRLYVADWTHGLAAVDLTTRELRWLAPPAGSTVLGIDGLARVARSEDALVAIQNGVRPHRITRFELAPDGRSLTSATLLERAVPGWDEPTLGVVVGDALLYVANSQWPRFGEDGATPAAESLAQPTIRRLPLPPR